MVFCETKPKNAHSTWQEKPPHRSGLQHVDRLVTLCPPCHAQTDAPYVLGRLVITPLGQGRFTLTVVRGTDKWATRG